MTTTTTTNNNAGGLIRGAILSAIMLTAGGAGTIGASKYFAPQSPTPAAEVSGAGQTPKPPAAEKTPAWNAIIEQQQSDGTWKQIGEQHLQPGS